MAIIPSKIRTSVLALFFSALAAGNAAALTYGDPTTIYSENFDDDVAMSAVVPQVDVFGAGRLRELDFGNIPHPPVSLESAPGVPRASGGAPIGCAKPAQPYRRRKSV